MHHEQAQALTEIRANHSRLDLPTIEGMAEWAHARLGTSVVHPDPALLIRACGYRVVRTNDLSMRAMYLDGDVIWRPCADRRRLGFALHHELAHALLARAGTPHTHCDVQLLTLALIAPRSTMRHGRFGRHRFAPAWAIRMRIEMLRAVAEAA